MMRATLSFGAVVAGLLCSLPLYGCDGGDDDEAGFPDLRGVYRGTSTRTQSGCLNPANNGTSTDSNATVNISSQSGADFSGTAQGADGSTVNLTGQLTTDGAASGTITFASGGATAAWEIAPAGVRCSWGAAVCCEYWTGPSGRV